MNKIIKAIEPPTIVGVIFIILVVGGFVYFANIADDFYVNSTERYLVTGEKDGEKVERVVNLHLIYRRQSATAPIIKETDGYGQMYHHIYYTKAERDDTIYGFDTICNIRKL